MPELYLVRHGQASFGAKNYDLLSPLGEQQARWLGEYFAQRDIRFAELQRGDLVRHQQTADGICQTFEQAISPGQQGSLNHSILPAWNEFDFQAIGRAYLHLHPEHTLLDSAPPADFYRLLKKAMLAWAKDELPVNLLPESWSEYRARVLAAMQGLQQLKTKQAIIVVSSGGTISMFMGIVMGLDPKQIIELNMQIRNTSFTLFHLSERSVRLNSFNNIGHLDLPKRRSSVTYS